MYVTIHDIFLYVIVQHLLHIP